MSDQPETFTVWAVRYGNYEPSEILALYANPVAAARHVRSDRQRAESDPQFESMLEVVPMAVLHACDPETKAS